ncbi:MULTISPECIES: DUF1150 family protein [Thalassospira]|uniref:DUF1150 domain-containing protein n=2 Tax=Thalassospira TaxID=168934 RepID=A0A358HYZ8_9PROT|nr:MULTISPECIES: DUF1150 family protein [Thalassospira]MBV17124.1 DUF1150 domain-containing protein [Thalassospira sp.]PKR58773.1 DUF1150 domain-containing protein [Thalassospira lohafexi]RCK26846.1 hypothetical protein TH1_11205 [Thalassospira lucentensis MCCC 1A00383 = DSM 14000]HBV00223.1 DUF1150 domain-containing protein [Thalassospira lucentensis]HCW65693.1 DUF1150 domain-containing protein [Thalassospira lucentensis]|tara:strand:+ start:12880 stop:13146 length:267 start_codon:yes stop_codon:yes gene_type:complete
MTDRTAQLSPKSTPRGAQDTGLLSNVDFAMLGIHDFAYVREVPSNEEDSEEMVFGVFTADGTHIASFDSHAVANAAIRQHDMEPRAVH